MVDSNNLLFAYSDKIVKKEKLKHARPDKPVKPVSVKKDSTPVKVDKVFLMTTCTLLPRFVLN